MLQSLLYNLTSFTPLQELRRAQMQSRSGSTFGRVLSYDGVEIFREHNFVLMHFLHRRRPWIIYELRNSDSSYVRPPCKHENFKRSFVNCCLLTCNLLSVFFITGVWWVFFNKVRVSVSVSDIPTHSYCTRCCGSGLAAVFLRDVMQLGFRFVVIHCVTRWRRESMTYSKSVLQLVVAVMMKVKKNLLLVLWRCWLDSWKNILPVKQLSDGTLGVAMLLEFCMSQSSTPVTCCCSQIQVVLEYWNTSEIARWMQSNRLSLNPSKTQFMRCATARRLTQLSSSPITFCGQQMIQETSVCNLGVTVDSSLSFRTHINRVVSSCFHQLRGIKSSLKALPQEIAKSFFAVFCGWGTGNFPVSI